MPISKNALLRYKILDELLAKHIPFSMKELNEKCSERMGMEVGKRTTEKDLEFLQFGGLFHAELKTVKRSGIPYYTYRNHTFSIFKSDAEYSAETLSLLEELIKIVSSIDGLPDLSDFKVLQHGLRVEEMPQVFSFSRNANLHGADWLGPLFQYISSRTAITLEYQPFNGKLIKDVFHPWLLKQYNDRWFLIGCNDEDKIHTPALDRIISVEPLETVVYKPRPENLLERYEEIVGVTYYDDKPEQKILYWVSDKSVDYVETKPIHGSQKRIKNSERLQLLHDKYPKLEGGRFFEISCRPNYELFRELMSFGKELIVLEPTTIRQEIADKLHDFINAYKQTE